MSDIKNIFNLKKKNRKLKGEIKIINYIYLIISIAACITMEMSAVQMCNEISVDHTFISIVAICVFAAFSVCIFSYAYIIHPIIQHKEKLIDYNIRKINAIRES